MNQSEDGLPGRFQTLSGLLLPKYNARITSQVPIIMN